ncbi:MAG: DEAD/DEAH box helicase [Salinivirgaceae bacterium]|nr:DEAD/DEAH box helicase [Salinivirgaceae bacterium]
MSETQSKIVKNQKPRFSKPNKQRVSTKRQKQQKMLDPQLFVKDAAPIKERSFLATRKIIDLPVNEKIIANLLKKKYEILTEIQDKTIDFILDGRNLMGLAQTGTGKTGAFLIPLIHNLMEQRAANQVLIVAPTRELAVQTNDEFKSMAVGLNMASICLIGGTNVATDVRKLHQPHHFVIGTPGRLMDLTRQGALKLNQFKVIILDEFDRLLDMGFWRDIEFIIERMKNRQQTILFSATEERDQKPKIQKLLQNPVEIRTIAENRSADTVDQQIVSVANGEKKIDVLLSMVRNNEFEKVLVFAETKRWVSRICKDLRRGGINVDEIHGNKSQNYRLKALESFKNKKIQVLVATDVAARGLDISHVSHVINYQQPKDLDSYIHRIGRTGRAGQSGKAITFIN